MTSLVRVLVFVALAGATAPSQTPAWRDLFDGRTLDGWRVAGVGQFVVADGEIRATSPKKSFLVTEERFGDFVLEAEVLVPDGGNSGIQFRTEVDDKGRVVGYQAEVDPSPRAWAGGLYDEGRRAWLAPLTGRPNAQAAYRHGEWNRYRIVALGDWIRIWLNGVLTTEYRDAIALDGVIGLQHHGEKELEYRFRKVRIRDLGRSSWRLLFDGASLAGWTSNGAGAWTVEDGALVGRGKLDARHGLLWSDLEAGDFTARVHFRSNAGNSGFYFRAVETKDAAACRGIQAEIDAGEAAGGLYETGGRGWLARPDPATLAKAYQKDDWNSMTVSAWGPRLAVDLNGTRVAATADATPGSGRFALQLHGGEEMDVRVAGVELLHTPALAQPLELDDPVALFNGRDLTGWRAWLDPKSDAKPEAVWRVSDGELVCSGAGPGYVLTDDAFGDYALDLDWRWNSHETPAPRRRNSGVLVHVTGPDAIWPKGVEAQLMEGHAGDFWCLGGSSIAADPTRADPKSPLHFRRLGADLERPVGEWNHLRVVCRADAVQVLVNGQLANEGTSCFASSGRILLQSEGAEIRFRNVVLTRD